MGGRSLFFGGRPLVDEGSCRRYRHRWQNLFGGGLKGSAVFGGLKRSAEISYKYVMTAMAGFIIPAEPGRTAGAFIPHSAPEVVVNFFGTGKLGEALISSPLFLGAQSVQPVSESAKQLQNSSSGSASLYVFVILLFVLLNGFFAAAEMAVVTLNDNKIRKMAAAGDPKAMKLLGFIRDQGGFLATTQIGVTLSGFLSASFAAERFAGDLYKSLDPLGKAPWLQTLSMILITILISCVSLVLGELVPKRIGVNCAEKFSARFVGVFSFLDYIFKPMTIMLDFFAVNISKLLGIDPNITEEVVTEENIKLMAETGSSTGAIDGEEAEMIGNIFDLDDTEVTSVMTPRTSVLALQADSTWDEVMHVASTEKFSRIPVYGEDMDNILGILHIRDLIALDESQKGDNFELRDVIKSAFVISESKTASFAFKEMRRNRVSLAIVIDEYGGTEGIVSLEDIIEEIVGDILDEYDESVQNYFRVSDTQYKVEGMMDTDDAAKIIPQLEDVFNSNEDRDDYDTVAGYMLSRLERVPENDEHPIVTADNGITFKVMAMDERRIAEIMITLPPEMVEKNITEAENSQLQKA